MDCIEFFPVGWAQLAAVYDHGCAYARSLDFYNKVILWQWLRLPGDILFAIGALLMVIDFILKMRMFWLHGTEQESSTLTSEKIVF
jgi:nitric oxide reductase subunit B